MKRRKDGVPPLESDPERNLWFWQHTAEDGHYIEFSNKPHPLLPHRCNFHGWYVSEPCPSLHAKTSKREREGTPRRRAVRP
jgi:hypothetical protein